MNGANKLGRPN